MVEGIYPYVITVSIQIVLVKVINNKLVEISEKHLEAKVVKKERVRDFASNLFPYEIDVKDLKVV